MGREDTILVVGGTGMIGEQVARQAGSANDVAALLV